MQEVKKGLPVFNLDRFTSGGMFNNFVEDRTNLIKISNLIYANVSKYYLNINNGVINNYNICTYSKYYNDDNNDNSSNTYDNHNNSDFYQQKLVISRN